MYMGGGGRSNTCFPVPDLDTFTLVGRSSTTLRSGMSGQNFPRCNTPGQKPNRSSGASLFPTKQPHHDRCIAVRSATNKSQHDDGRGRRKWHGRERRRRHEWLCRGRDDGRRTNGRGVGRARHTHRPGPSGNVARLRPLHFVVRIVRVWNQMCATTIGLLNALFARTGIQ